MNNPEPHAPVALFIYGRPEHTRRTLDALARADGANMTDLIVFADGPRGKDDVDRVAATRQVARAARGFRSVTMVERTENLGLSKNIIEGVSATVAEHGRAIIVEDDIFVSRGFLEYMNTALDRFQDDERVWHISGWNYPIDPAGIPKFFFWGMMNCWGWATWADRWSHYDKNPRRLLSWTRPKRRRFNLDGHYNYFSQAIDNYYGFNDVWAVYWYATIFDNNGLCLNPTRSFVENIGMDGTGENCGFGTENPVDPEMPFEDELPVVEINEEAIQRIKRHLHLPLYRRFMIRRRMRWTRERLKCAIAGGETRPSGNCHDQ